MNAISQQNSDEIIPEQEFAGMANLNENSDNIVIMTTDLNC